VNEEKHEHVFQIGVAVILYWFMSGEQSFFSLLQLFQMIEGFEYAPLTLESLSGYKSL
jgi:hypothetical protein